MVRDNDTDPRMASEYVTTVSGEAGDVTLVGVVHDHPASVYRVRRVLDRESPDVLALELPPPAVGLFEEYADDDRTPPRFGGEMSAAVQAAATDDVVGIDGPTVAFCRRLAARLVDERASAETVAQTLRGLAGVTKKTLLCRAAAAVGGATSLQVEVGSPTAHAATHADPPAQQAADERSQIRRANSVLAALESTPASKYRSAVRERHMAERLGDHRRRGDVVAVVGVGHFDPIVDYLGAA